MPACRSTIDSELAGRDFVRCDWRVGSADAVPFGELPGPALEAERSGDAFQFSFTAGAHNMNFPFECASRYLQVF
jgi:hypothetical protein